MPKKLAAAMDRWHEAERTLHETAQKFRAAQISRDRAKAEVLVEHTRALGRRRKP